MNDDLDAIRRVLAADVESYRRIVERYQRPLLTLVRKLTPPGTDHEGVAQVLHGNTACQHVVHFGGWAFSASAYCQARKRLPLCLWEYLLESTAARLRRTTEPQGRWRGHRVWIIDGSSFSMPDVPALR